MKAARVHHTGDPEVLVLEEAPVPTPARGEVLVKVDSASVNYSDLVRRRGEPYPYPTPSPFVPGAEIAGTVVGHGEGISEPPLGTPVFALLGDAGAGGYAQYAVARSERLVVLPPPLDADPDGACTLVVAGVTALQVLTECGRMAAGDTAWIPAAAGGVGTYAVQIARALGAGKIIAGVGDLEMTGGGAIFAQTLSILAAFGRLVVYGTAARELGKVEPVRLLPQNQSVTGYYVSAWFAKRPQAAVRALQQLIELIRARKISVRIGSVLPLADAALAHRLLEGRTSVGKIVLKPWPVGP